MKVRSALAGAAAAIVAVAISAVPAHAAASPEKITKCGQVITRDAYLAQDLTCRTGFSVKTVAPDGPALRATLDLRGHRLSGTGTGVGLYVFDYPWYPRLDVKNGRLDHWDTAVVADFAALTMTNVRLDSNTTGLVCNANCVIRSGVITKNSVGTWAGEGGVVLTNTLVTGNGTGSVARGFPAVYTILNSIFVNNKVGLDVAGASSGVTVKQSAFIANGYGIRSINASDDSTDIYLRLEQNQFLGNGDGVYLTGVFTAAIGNTLAVKNTRYGIYAPGATDLGGNKAAANGKPCVGVVCTKP